MSIGENLKKILSSLPLGVQLIAVSKTKSNEDIMEAYNAGQRIFGENKVQELLQKWESLPKDIEWHFIGHLQSNKVKFIAPFISMIHAADSHKILKTINEEAKRQGRKIPCLLQFHIASEESKFGFRPEDVEHLFTDIMLEELKYITFSGVMGMATYTDNTVLINHEFSKLNNLFQITKEYYFSSTEDFREISMGMSDDYILAIQNGSTMVRIGSTLFGKRLYLNEE